MITTAGVPRPGRLERGELLSVCIEEVSGSFLHAPAYRYWFTVVRGPDYEGNRHAGSLSQNLRTFGVHLGPYGLVRHAPPEASAATRLEVAGLWEEHDPKTADAIRKTLDPLLLVTARDTRGEPRFDPTSDPHGLVWLGEHDPDDLWRVLATLAQVTNDTKEDIFDFLRKAERARTTNAILGSIEAKLPFPGVSVDLIALVKAIRAGR